MDQAEPGRYAASGERYSYIVRRLGPTSAYGWELSVFLPDGKSWNVGVYRTMIQARYHAAKHEITQEES